jgi:hypothetical protein
MFRRMMSGDCLKDPSRFLRAKRLIEGGRFMGMQVVRHPHNLFRLRKMHLDKVFEAMGKVDIRTPVCDLHVSPPFHRGQEHAQVADAVALIFISIALRLAWFARSGRSGFFDLLLTRFIKAHQRMCGRIRPMRAFKRILHGTHKVGIGLGRNAPLFVSPGFAGRFFHVRRTVASEMLSTTWSSTSLSA